MDKQELKDPVSIHFNRIVSPKIRPLFVRSGRKPGGVLLRKKRLRKKHEKWVRTNALRLDSAEADVASAMADIFSALIKEGEAVLQSRRLTFRSETGETPKKP